MSARNERIVSYSAEELAAMRRRGEIGGNWARAAERPMPDGSDPDDALDDYDSQDDAADTPPARRPAA